MTSWSYSGGTFPSPQFRMASLNLMCQDFSRHLLELVVSVNHLGTSPVNGMFMGSQVFCQGRLGHVFACSGSSMLQSVAQLPPCLANVHLQAITTWDLVDHSCLLCGVWFFRCTNICQKVEVVRSRYEHLAGLGYVEWAWRDAGCIGSLPWLLVSHLLNSAGWNWLLCTSYRSHVVLGSHYFSGPWLCVSFLSLPGNIGA